MVTQANNEWELLLKYKNARFEVASLERKMEAAKEELFHAENNLRELMEAENKKKTAEYEGVGFVAIEKPRVYASCPEEKKKDLFEYLGSIGRGDLIKQVVNAQTLSTFTKEILEQIDRGERTEPVPECINYYLKPTMKFYERA